MEEVKVSVSQLPEGPPADRGLSLDDSIPGTKTFVKPLDDDGDHPVEDESIHRIDNPHDRGKDQSVSDGGQTLTDTPSYMGKGEWDRDNPSKTKYPYRDDVTLARMVVAEWRLRSSFSRVASRWRDILQGLNPKFLERSKTVGVTLKRVDRKNLRWIFAVKGNHDYLVKLRVLRRGIVQDILKMDLELTCSCPAWQWQGPEYHSTTEDYQLGKPRGTASPPDIRDPERQNFVCKHVAAVLNFVKDWKIPLTPPSKSRAR